MVGGEGAPGQAPPPQQATPWQLSKHHHPLPLSPDSGPVGMMGGA